MSTAKVQRSDGSETRALLKAVAQRLFALHGIDGVAVKDIVEAAGQRNKASVQYHFGTREALIGELLVDGARQVDRIRQEMLDEMEGRGGPRDVREVLEAFIKPVDQLTESVEHSTYLRFLLNVQMTHRPLMRSHIGNRWNTGYRRCLEHFRAMLGHIPASLLEQRLSLVGIYATAIFAAKEASLEEAQPRNRFWTPAHTLDNIIDTYQAMLECAPSEATRRQLAERG
jgi:AcrR family transcriptional regulator